MLVLWPVGVEGAVTEGDIVSAGRFVSDARRCQHLAGRAALRSVVGMEVEVGYDEAGAPVLRGGAGLPYISVSHTCGMAAAAVDERPCAVDIERVDRDVERVRGRFVSRNEEELPDAGRDDFAIAVWCAKEVLYKLGGRREVDFLSDLRITSCDLAGGWIRAGDVAMRVLRHGDYIIVHNMVESV